MSRKVLRNYARDSLGSVYELAVKKAVFETNMEATDFPEVCPYILDEILHKSEFG
jgi:hypothetical protein